MGGAGLTTTETETMLSELARVKKQVDRIVLDDLLPKSSPIREVDLLYKMMRDYPERPAKGMRALMCVGSCRALGGKEQDALLTAAGIELFQNWILIHDDIEDGSEMRRGSPALHRKHDWRLALNAGDALHAAMWGALLKNRNRLGAAKTVSLMEEFAKMVAETTEGQHIELGWVITNRWDLRDSDYYEMCTKKTSWYTAITPLRLGGVIADADTRSMDLFVEAGKKFGVGFQIHDDVLNLSGDASKYGKEIGDDLLEGKRTLILIRLLSLCSTSERAKVVKLFDLSREERKEQAGYVSDLIRKYGTLDYAKRRSVELVAEARDLLKQVDWRGEKDYAGLLDSLAKFAIERDW